ncbi:MAG: serine/threonine protein kinase, partial [Myxococcales bacterium]|nr:serine/threonine protein kinase [Myxococcales bacterium]
ELLEGRELGDYLEERGRVPVSFAVNIVRQVCRALIEAHDKGVVHRDIKPENVFLSGDISSPIAKVLDFGISRLEGQQGNTLTKTGFIMGTPSYMAPEQAKGLRVDHRVDIYSVGAILYQMVTGRIPFDRADATATLAAVLTEEPEPPRAIAPDIPEHLEMIIQRAMAREPEDRFQSMDELDLALAPYDDFAEIADEPSRSLRLRPLHPSVLDAAAEARAATAARPELTFYGGVAIFSCLTGLMVIVSAVLRLAKDAPYATISGVESLVIALVLVAAVSSPLFLVLRHVKRTIWPNTARVLELLTRLRPPVLAGLGTYALGTLCLHAAEAVVVRRAVDVAWPGWDLVLPLFSLAVAGATAVGVGTSQKPGFVDRLGLAVGAGIVAGLGGVIVLASLAGRAEGEPTAATPSEAPSATAAEESDDVPTAAPTASVTDPPMSTGAAQAQWAKVVRYMELGATKDAIDSLGPLFELDPLAGKDSNVRGGLVTLSVRACLTQGDTCNRMLEILTKEAGTAGPDVLFDLLTTKGGTSANKHAARLLKTQAVRASASPALLIAYDLRTAPDCSAVRELYLRAATEGDHRTLRELKMVASRRECRIVKCCLPDDKDLKALIDQLKDKL